MKKKKLRIIIGFVLTIILFLVILIVLINRKKDYSLEYEKKGYIIKELYNSALNMYYFVVTNEDKTFEFVLENKYIGKTLINDVDSYKSDEYTCLLLKSPKLSFIPSCYNSEIAVSYDIIEEETFDAFFKNEDVKYNNFSYNNIDINTLLDKTFIIWNNKGYILLNEEKQTENLFLKNESYYDTLSYANERYVLYPDYDQKYAFDKIFVLDMKTGKLKEWQLDAEISFNSYYLGTHNEKIYIIDKKNQKEYVLNPKKKSLEIVTDKNNNGRVWNNDWETISMVKLVNNEYTFKDNQIFNYTLENSKLYLNYFKSNNNILISNKQVDKIVYAKKDEVYYLSKGSLYYYSNKTGEILLMTYSEWNFNKENPIYIY